MNTTAPQYLVEVHGSKSIAPVYVYGDSMTTPIKPLALRFEKTEAMAYAAKLAQTYNPRRAAEGMTPLGFIIVEA